MITACRRGKDNQKHYTVFIASLSSEHKAAFQPQLNDEHSEARWFSWTEILGDDAPPLHPVVKQLLKEPARKELAAALPLWDGLQGDTDSKRHPVEKRGAGLLFV